MGGIRAVEKCYFNNLAYPHNGTSYSITHYDTLSMRDAKIEEYLTLLCDVAIVMPGAISEQSSNEIDLYDDFESAMIGFSRKVREK